jgi:hypothetical protein
MFRRDVAKTHGAGFADGSVARRLRAESPALELALDEP